jgi:hypothetical protein
VDQRAQWLSRAHQAAALEGSPHTAMRGDDVIGMILDPATQRLGF